jgi:membrane-associated protein
MEAVIELVQTTLELDALLGQLVARFRGWVYGVLFGVVFAETGLVVMPFLPGDSLLFAAGTLAAARYLSLWLLLPVFMAAAVLGDLVNYLIGARLGRAALLSGKLPFITSRHVAATEAFFARHGGKAIILARFVPFARTLAPFLAGAARMDPVRFWLFNVTGAVLWVLTFVVGGYLFGSVPLVRDNLTLAMAAVLLASLAPAAVAWLRRRRKSAEAASADAAANRDGGGS